MRLLAVSLDLGTGEMIGRVALATVLAGALGVEREVSGQPAGFRTHIVLALGALLFGLISIHAFDPFEAPTNTTNVRVDVTRVASQVVVGIGFLGAGAILKQGGSVRGLTTAASLWVAAAVGLAVGLGFYAPAIAVTVATLISLVGLRGVRRVIRRRLARELDRATIRLAPGADAASVVAGIQGLAGVDMVDLSIERDEETRALTITITAQSGMGGDLETSLAPLAERDDVEEVVIT